MNRNAIQAIKMAGGASRLASVLGLTRQAVRKWKEIPPKYVVIIEGLTGVSRHLLRPDIFGFNPITEQSEQRNTRLPERVL